MSNQVTIVTPDNTDNCNTTKVILSGEYFCIPTVNNRNTVSLTSRKKSGVGWNKQASACYTDDSNKSFIVGKVAREIDVFRANGLAGRNWSSLNILQNTSKSDHGHQYSTEHLMECYAL